MAPLSTKQKILNASIQLFNDHGIANVRLQQIANHIDISVGNLTYHFKNKEAIIEAIYEGLSEDLSKILSTYRIFPNLMDFDNQLSQYYQFAQQYPFYFMDSLEIVRFYPQIHAQQHALTQKMTIQIRKRFDYNQQRGILIEEPEPETYNHLANTIWMLISFWEPQCLMQSKSETNQSTHFKKNIWTLLLPYFTENGKTEFQQLILPMLVKTSS